MNGSIRLVCALAAAAVLAAGSALAADEPENLVKYRQNVMKSVGANITNMAMVAKGEISTMANLAANAQAVRDGLGAAGVLFPIGTGPDSGKTRALPAIWERSAEFIESLKSSIAAADEMIVAANSGDLGQVRTALGALGKTCGGCHDDFRQKQ